MENKENRDILLKLLEIQWQDHIQTRNQTWKGLEISTLLTVALVGLDWQIDQPAVTCVASVLLALVALFGMQITIRHRNNVEVKKFEIINDLERQLGLKSDHVLPGKIKWWFVFLINRSNTSLFILRMQFILLLFAVCYLSVRLSGM